MRGERPQVLIAGAGITGLSVALGLARRKVSSLVVDPRKALGGLASTRSLGGRPVHAGVHLIHPSHERLRPLFNEMVALMGPSAVWVEPRALIYFGGKYFSYPIRMPDVFSKLGALESLHVLGSAFASRLWGESRGGDSFENVVKKAYGERLYRMFFAQYTEKVLGIPPSQIAGEWARRRVPMPGLATLAMALLPGFRPSRVVHAHAPFLRRQVSGPQGLDELFLGIVNATQGLARVDLGRFVERVELRDGRLAAVIVSGQEYEPKAFVSSMPITELVCRLSPPPPEAIVEEANHLRFRGLLFVLLILKGRGILPAHWVYYSDPTLPFNRVSEVANIVPSFYEPGITSICAEVGYFEGEEVEEGRLVSHVIEGLSHVTGYEISKNLIDFCVFSEPYAYPLWSFGFRTHLEKVLAYLDSIEGLFTVGRQGRFDYLNMDECMEKGLLMAEKVFQYLGS